MTRVSVIGGGLAGLACALAAASRGLQVQVFEAGAAARAASPRQVVVGPGMMRDLVDLGIGDDCVREGFAFRGIDIIDRQGRTRHELAIARIAGERYPAALGITHDRLAGVVATAAQARGARLRHAASVVAVSCDGDRPPLLRLDTGDQVESDLVVLACGAASPLRTALFPQAPAAADIGQAWWCVQVRRPTGLDRPLIAIGGIGRKAILVPVSGDAAALTLVGPAGADAPPSPAQMRKALSKFAPRLRELARQLDDDAVVARIPARSGLLPAPWHRARVIAAGDCAHALPPHLGQACSQAIEDAAVLGGLIDTCPDRAELARRYGEGRAARVQRVHALLSAVSRWYVEPDGETDLATSTNRLAEVVAQRA